MLSWSLCTGIGDGKTLNFRPQTVITTGIQYTGIQYTGEQTVYRRYTVHRYTVYTGIQTVITTGIQCTGIQYTQVGYTRSYEAEINLRKAQTSSTTAASLYVLTGHLHD